MKMFAPSKMTRHGKITSSIVRHTVEQPWQCLGTNAAASTTVTQEKISSFDEIPSPPRYPLIGHMHLLMGGVDRQQHKFYGDLRAKYGDIVRLGLPGMGETVALFNPKHSEQLLAHEGQMPLMPWFEPIERMRKGDQLKHIFGGSFGLLTQGEEWYEFRRAVQQDMMRVSSAMYYINDIESISRELVDKIKESADEGQPLSVEPWLHQYALEAVGAIFLGSRLGALQESQDSQKIKHAGDVFLECLIYSFMIPPALFPFTPWHKKMLDAGLIMWGLIAERVKESVEKVDHESTTGANEAVITKIIHKCGKDSTIPIVMAIDALAAGIDTTGCSAAFLLYHLATNPAVQEKLHQELIRVLGTDKARPIAKADLDQLVYLKACLKESQRLLPVTVGTVRKLQEDIVLGGYHIPKGVVAFRVGQVMSNDPEIFAAPEQFIPERWIRGSEQRYKGSSFAYLPFGHGPRSCIGKRFARLELHMMLATIVRHFRMEYEGPEIDTETTFVSRPNHQVNIKFYSRD